jgi:hypothetical protein
MTGASGGMARNSSINSETVMCRPSSDLRDPTRRAWNQPLPGQLHIGAQMLAGRTIFLGPKTKSSMKNLKAIEWAG